jgi:hypothetical protein
LITKHGARFDHDLEELWNITAIKEAYKACDHLDTDLLTQIEGELIYLRYIITLSYFQNFPRDLFVMSGLPDMTKYQSFSILKKPLTLFGVMFYVIMTEFQKFW